MLGVCFLMVRAFREKFLVSTKRERNGARLYCCGVVECPSSLLMRTLLVVVLVLRHVVIAPLESFFVQRRFG